MKQRIVQDVSALPTYNFGSKSGPWWGTLGFVALEGMGFALAIGTYLYLMATNPAWPIDASPPDLSMGTTMTLLLLLSVAPNYCTSIAAERLDLHRVRLGLVIMCVIGTAALVIRGFEFAHLNTRWYLDAYGSIVWFILGLHTTHLVTDLGDTLVLTVLMFTRHAQPRRFSDVSDNAFYWNFVVIAWLALYFLIYWVVRL
jgi:heme/copper-type cytochrome/quinol oxidase subunit 3